MDQSALGLHSARRTGGASRSFQRIAHEASDSVWRDRRGVTRPQSQPEPSSSGVRECVLACLRTLT